MGTAANWMGNLIISSTFLEISERTKLTGYGTLFLFSLCSFLGSLWIYFVLPETLHSTFIESEDFFTQEGDDDNDNGYEDDITNINYFRANDEKSSLMSQNSQNQTKVTFAAYDTVLTNSFQQDSSQNSF